MKEKLDELARSHRRRELSRRELALGLSGATAAWAGAAGVAGVVGGAGAAQATGVRIAPAGGAVAGAVYVPAATGGGADDYVAIQNAIDAAAAAGGGQVVIGQPLLTGSALTMKTGVELAGEGRLASSISAHPAMSSTVMIEVEDDAHHVGFRGLTLDSSGICPRAIVELGPGCHQIWATGVRFTGWDPGTPGVSALRLTDPPDIAGSNTPIRAVRVEGCEFDEIGNGVAVSGGALDVAVLDSYFTGIHRRGVWVFGGGEYSSRNIQIVGNTMVDFPADPDMSNPITVGDVGDLPHETIFIGRNVIVGNGDFHGPGGAGTADHFSLHCVRHCQLVGNASYDSGETGFAMADCQDTVLVGNSSIASDIAGFAVVARWARTIGMHFIGNYAQGNGMNRSGSPGFLEVKSGFSLRDVALGVYDTVFVANRAWDDKSQKTQNYALAVENDTIYKTTLIGNLWRASQHVLGTVFNRGRQTSEAQYAFLPRVP